MKKLLFLILILTLSVYPVYGAFGAASQWNVRTDGADTNGGAFDSGVGSPGTDESLGASGTAITVTLTGTTTGTCSPACTSTTHGPGNFIHIASGSGCTTGWFEVLSQAAGTITVDHAMGSATNTCTGMIGGGLLTIGTATGQSVTQNKINIKSGTYTITSTISVGTDQLTFSGYNSTYGDFGTPPLITTATNSVHIFSINVGGGGNDGELFINLSLSNTAGTRFDGIAAVSGYGQQTVVKCTFDGFRFAINGGGGDGQAIAILHIDSSEIKNSTSDAILSENGVYATNNYIHNNTGVGINDTNTGGYSLFAAHNIVVNNGGAGIIYNSFNNQYGAVLVNNTIAGNTGNGITFTGTFTLPPGAGLSLLCNIIYNNGGFGVSIPNNVINPPGAVVAIYNTNGYGSNTSGNKQNFTTSTGDIALTASPFVSSTNFALNSTSGGGLALRQTCYPGVFPGGLTTGFLDVGAVQTSGGPGSSSVAGGAFVQ